MTRRIRLSLCLLILILGVVAKATVRASDEPLDVAPLLPRTQETKSSVAIIKPGQTFNIDVSGLSRKLGELPVEERPEQLADWAVLGTVLQAGTSPEDIRSALYDKVPLRLASLEETANFDYGRGRRALLGDGTVWLFYPASDASRQATLGRLADQVRMELGHLPQSFVVYSYRPDLSRQTIFIEREEDLSAQTLFSPDYGYRQRRIQSQRELAEWLADIDDVTYAAIQDRAVVLGGRRFDDARTAGVTLMDIAALYQANQATSNGKAKQSSQLLKAPGFSLDPQWHGEQLAADLHRLLEDPSALVAQAQAIVSDGRKYDEAATPVAVITARDVLEKCAGDGCRNVLTPIWRERLEEVLAKAQSGKRIADESVVALLQLQADIEKGAFSAGTYTFDQAMQILALTKFIEALDHYQCSRYDGPLQGTRVGMVLFYTDLVAKLWPDDYGHSAPVADLEGFPSTLQVAPQIEPVYWQEMHRLPGVRLWFGPRKDGYSVTPDESTLHLAHIATRVYAAGSNQLNPGHEERPAELFRRQIGWLDRHFADLAQYEPQYHVQNQIMKWSVITGWLAEKNLLADLQEVAVDHDQRFDKWYAETPGLKHRGDIRMIPEEKWVDRTECLELFRTAPVSIAGSLSYMQGGVSLGSRQTLAEGTRILESISPTLRRGGMIYDRSSAARLVSWKDTAFKLPSTVSKNMARSIMEPAQTVRMRLGSVAMRAGRIETQVANQVRYGDVILKTEAGPLGHLSYQRAPTNIRLSWGEEIIETDRALLNRMTARGQSTEALLQDSRLGARQGGFVVESERGTEVLFEGMGPPKGPRGPRGIVAADAEGSEFGASYLRSAMEGLGKVRTFEARPLSTSEVAERIADAKWQRIEYSTADKSSTLPGQINRLFTSTGPGSNARTIVLETGNSRLPEITAYIDGDRIFLERPVDPGAQDAFDHFVDQAGVSPRYLTEIFEHLQAQLKRVASSSLTHDPALKAADSLVASGDLKGALDHLGEAGKSRPLEDVVRLFQERALAQQKALLQEGEAVPALRRFLAKEESLHPEELLQDAIGEMEHGIGGLKLPRAPGGSSAHVGGPNLPHGKPGAGFWAALVDISRDSNPAVRDFLLAKNGKFAGLSTEVAQKVKLRNVGFAWRTSVELPAAERGAELSIELRGAMPAKVRDGSALLYVEDSGVLSKLDWDLMPGKTLSQVSKDPAYVWIELKFDSFGSFRPTELTAAGKSYTRRLAVDADRNIGSNLAEAAAKQARASGYLIRRCEDLNHDGSVDAAERRRCLGAP